MEKNNIETNSKMLLIKEQVDDNSVNIYQYLKSGIILTLFSINIGYLDDITLFIGQILMLIGLERLSKENRPFNKAYIFMYMKIILHLGSYIIPAFPTSTITQSYYHLTMIPMAAVLFYMGEGFKACSVSKDEVNKLLFPMTGYILIDIMLFSMSENEEQTILFILISSIILIWIVVRVFRCCRDMVDAKYVVNDIGKIKSVKITALMIGLLGIILAGVVLLPAYIQVDKGTLIEKTTDEQIVKIYENLLALGYDQELLDVLDDQEIMELKDAVKYQNSTDAYFESIHVATAVLKDNTTRVIVSFKDESDNPSRRAVYLGIGRHSDMMISNTTGSIVSLDNKGNKFRYKYTQLEQLDRLDKTILKQDVIAITDEPDAVYSVFESVNRTHTPLYGAYPPDTYIIAQANTKATKANYHISYIAFTIDTSSGTESEECRFEIYAGYKQAQSPLNYPYTNLLNKLVDIERSSWMYTEGDGDTEMYNTLLCPMGLEYYESQYIKDEETIYSVEDVREELSASKRFDYKQINIEELEKLQNEKADFYLIDARNNGDYREWHAPDAKQIILDKLNLDKDSNIHVKVFIPDKEKMVVVYSISEADSVKMCEALSRWGYKIIRDLGVHPEDEKYYVKD